MKNKNNWDEISIYQLYSFGNRKLCQLKKWGCLKSVEFGIIYGCHGIDSVSRPEIALQKMEYDEWDKKCSDSAGPAAIPELREYKISEYY